MSTDTDEDPPSKRIRLVYQEGSWIATDEDADVSVKAKSREAALASLDTKLECKFSIETDPIFTAPVFSSGRNTISENVDAFLNEFDHAERG